ncbi:MAG: autoinducer binding domain-containing protein [Pseudomonadota bacterium]
MQDYTHTVSAFEEHGGKDMHDGCDGGFSSLSPAGHYIALRVGYAYPLMEHNTLPEPWVRRYTQMGFMLHDPVMHWLYEFKGAIRWSRLRLPDPRNILQQAADFGLRYGVAISHVSSGPDGQRSFGSFARSDREFEEFEIRQLTAKLVQMHDKATPSVQLSYAELEVLSLVRDGLLQKEIAYELGISEGAIKQRLKNAKLKLGARTSSQAISVAVGFRLI